MLRGNKSLNFGVRFWCSGRRSCTYLYLSILVLLVFIYCCCLCGIWTAFCAFFGAFTIVYILLYYYTGSLWCFHFIGLCIAGFLAVFSAIIVSFYLFFSVGTWIGSPFPNLVFDCTFLRYTADRVLARACSQAQIFFLHFWTVFDWFLVVHYSLGVSVPF